MYFTIYNQEKTMPENKNDKTVDIDTSGPGAEVELDVKLPESDEIEVSNEKDNVKSIDTAAAI